jgi:branched-chain amino acid transport system substrate-binding protein
MKKILVVLVTLAILVTMGCQKPYQVTEWKIPFLNCVTGPIAAIGEYLQWGAEQAAREINAAGGIKPAGATKGIPVKIVPVDTASDPQKGSVEMANVVKDALVALGPVPEPVIMAAMPIAVENGMMSMTATTSYEYAVKYFPWTVSWFPPTEQRLGLLVAGWAKQFTDLKSVIQFVEPYGPWPGMADAHQKSLSAMGIKMLDKVEVPSDAVTFGPLVVKALNAKPDGIVFVCNAEKIAKIIKELKSRGWTKMDHLLVFSSGDAPELYTTGGADVNGVNVYNYINPDINTPRWNVFKDAFSKAHNGMAPFSLSPNYYDAVYMIKEAIEKTKVTGDPKKLKAERKLIADYIFNIKGFQGLQFNWDTKDGIPTNKPTYIFEIKDGKKILKTEVR